MASILAATSAATLDTREDTWPLSIDTFDSENCDLSNGKRIRQLRGDLGCPTQK
jgi:hypothetical protein